MDPNFMIHLFNALIYSVLGLIIFVVGFVLIDWWTPYDLWKEIVEEQNNALAIMVAGISIGVCIIIAASVHG
jgi:putative membrane protein